MARVNWQSFVNQKTGKFFSEWIARIYKIFLLNYVLKRHNILRFGWLQIRHWTESAISSPMF
jgi:hypothetical protein